MLLVDVGGGTTSAAVFIDGSISHALVLPVGGHHLTNDIAIGLRVPFHTAEEIKLRYGCALASEIDDDRTLNDGSPADGRGRQVSERMVSEILEARLAETFELVYTELRRAGYDGSLPAGVVLTGGTAQLRGIRELAGRGLPRSGAGGFAARSDWTDGRAGHARRRPLAWACCAGAVYRRRSRRPRPTTNSSVGRSARISHWLRALLPE